MAPQVGLEPTTDRLTADSSTTELLRNKITCQSRPYLLYEHATTVSSSFKNFFLVSSQPNNSGDVYILYQGDYR